MKKKFGFFAIILVIIMSLSVAISGCGKKDDDKTPVTPEPVPSVAKVTDGIFEMISSGEGYTLYTILNFYENGMYYLVTDWANKNAGQGTAKVGKWELTEDAVDYTDAAGAAKKSAKAIKFTTLGGEDEGICAYADNYIYQVLIKTTSSGQKPLANLKHEPVYTHTSANENEFVIADYDIEGSYGAKRITLKHFGVYTDTVLGSEINGTWKFNASGYTLTPSTGSEYTIATTDGGATYTNGDKTEQLIKYVPVSDLEEYFENAAAGNGESYKIGFKTNNTFELNGKIGFPVSLGAGTFTLVDGVYTLVFTTFGDDVTFEIANKTVTSTIDSTSGKDKTVLSLTFTYANSVKTVELSLVAPAYIMDKFTFEKEVTIPATDGGEDTVYKILYEVLLYSDDTFIYQSTAFKQTSVVGSGTFTVTDGTYALTLEGSTAAISSVKNAATGAVTVTILTDNGAGGTENITLTFVSKVTAVYVFTGTTTVTVQYVGDIVATINITLYSDKTVKVEIVYPAPINQTVVVENGTWDEADKFGMTIPNKLYFDNDRECASSIAPPNLNIVYTGTSNGTAITCTVSLPLASFAG